MQGQNQRPDNIIYTKLPAFISRKTQKPLQNRGTEHINRERQKAYLQLVPTTTHIGAWSIARILYLRCQSSRPNMNGAHTESISMGPELAQNCSLLRPCVTTDYGHGPSLSQPPASIEKSLKSTIQSPFTSPRKSRLFGLKHLAG